MKRNLLSVFLLLLFASAAFSQSDTADDAKRAADKAAEAAKDAADKAADAVRDAANRATYNEPGFKVKGRLVLADTGRPLRRVMVTLVRIAHLSYDEEYLENRPAVTIPSEFSVETYEAVPTNSRGEFVYRKKLPAGIYVAVVDDESILKPNKENLELDAIPKITISGESMGDLEIRLRRGGAISGHVRYPDGEPVVGALVRIVRFERFSPDEIAFDKEENTDAVLTNDAGYYRIIGVTPGKYTIEAVLPSVFSKPDQDMPFYGSDNSFYRKSALRIFHPGVPLIFDAKQVEVGLGSDYSEGDIEFVEKKLYRVSGRIVSKNNGKPVVGASLRFRPSGVLSESLIPGQASGETESDSKGNWELRDLPTGTYSYSVNTASESGTGFAAQTGEFEVGDENKKEFVIKLEKGAAVAGKITRIPEVYRIRVSLIGEEGTTDSISALGYHYNDDYTAKILNHEKSFELRDLKPGKYKFHSVGNQSVHVSKVLLNGKDITDKPFELKAGETLGKFEVRVAEPTKENLKVVIPDYKRHASHNVVVVPETKSSPIQSVVAMLSFRNAEDGKAIFSLPSGAYRVFLMPYDEPVTVKNKDGERAFKKWLDKSVRVVVSSKQQTVSLRIGDADEN